MQRSTSKDARTTIGQVVERAQAVVFEASEAVQISQLKMEEAQRIIDWLARIPAELEDVPMPDVPIYEEDRRDSHRQDQLNTSLWPLIPFTQSCHQKQPLIRSSE